MQTDIREAINSPKKEMPLLDKLHRAFLQLRPSTASSRALRLMSLLQDHNPEDYLAVDRGALEALLVAINSETPPMPQADELLMEHSWCNIWWGRLRGQDHPGYDDSELELHHVEEVQAARERAIREAEEADQDARELAMQRRMEEMAEQHMEQLKSSETPEAGRHGDGSGSGTQPGPPQKTIVRGYLYHGWGTDQGMGTGNWQKTDLYKYIYVPRPAPSLGNGIERDGRSRTATCRKSSETRTQGPGRAKKASASRLLASPTTSRSLRLKNSIDGGSKARSATRP